MPLSYYNKYTNGSELENNAEKSDWNMAYFHFQRYHELLKYADDCAISVLAFNKTGQYKPAIDLYYSSLRTLYINIMPNMLPDVIEKFEKLFKIAKDERLKFMNMTNPVNIVIFPTGLIDMLEEIHGGLVYVMYKHLGLGYPMIRNQSREKLIRKKIVEG